MRTAAAGCGSAARGALGAAVSWLVRSSRARWGLAAAFWTTVSIVYVLQLWLIPVPRGEALPYARLTVWQLVFAACWVPLTVGIWRLTDRWDPAALGWQRLLGRHAIAAMVIAPVQTVAVHVLVAFLVPSSGDWQWTTIVGQVRGRVYLQLIVYAGVAAAGHALSLATLRRDREARAAALEAQLAVVRFDMLRAQLHPHFLFNSLHAISSLVRDGRNADAVRMISGLGDLLRRVVESDTRELRLDEEVDLVRRYLEIQQVRFGDRLRADLTVDPDARGVVVPAFLLQPLVDNAVRHAVSARVAGGHVQVVVRAAPEGIHVHVDDDGEGMPAGWSIDAGPGTGLRNLRDRLQALYGVDAGLSIARSPLGGTRVALRIPWRVP